MAKVELNGGWSQGQDGQDGQRRFPGRLGGYGVPAVFVPTALKRKRRGRSARRADAPSAGHMADEGIGPTYIALKRKRRVTPGELPQLVHGYGLYSPLTEECNPLQNQLLTTDAENVLASSWALSAQKDARLTALIDGWESLSEPRKDAVSGMVKDAARVAHDDQGLVSPAGDTKSCSPPARRKAGGT